MYYNCCCFLFLYCSTGMQILAGIKNVKGQIKTPGRQRDFYSEGCCGRKSLAGSRRVASLMPVKRSAAAQTLKNKPSIKYISDFKPIRAAVEKKRVDRFRAMFHVRAAGSSYVT